MIAPAAAVSGGVRPAFAEGTEHAVEVVTVRRITVMMPTQSAPPMAVVRPNTIATTMIPTPAPASDSPTFLCPLVAMGVLPPQALQGHCDRLKARP